jgi:beta-glucosidase
LPPFQAAVQRGVGSIMISYSSWNGVKMHGHQYLITTVLKGELGFSGFVISDWNGIDQIDGAPGFTATEVRTAVNAGIDMVMVPQAWRTFITHAAHSAAGRVTTARIDDANRRILTRSSSSASSSAADRPHLDVPMGSAATATSPAEAVRSRKYC